MEAAQSSCSKTYDTGTVMYDDRCQSRAATNRAMPLRQVRDAEAPRRPAYEAMPELPLPSHPVEGGSCNNHDYACGDPVNGSDLTGLATDPLPAQLYDPCMNPGLLTYAQ